MKKSASENTTMVLEGRVITEDNRPLSGVNIEGPQGRYATTDALGYFKIPANLNDEIIIRRSDFETVFYKIRSYDSIEIQVQNTDEQKEALRQLSYEKLMDSAQVYLKKDAQKTADFLIAALSNSKNLSASKSSKAYEKLGDLYSFNNQHDLAITNYKAAIDALSKDNLQLKLASSYRKNGNYQEAIKILTDLTKTSRTGQSLKGVKLIEAYTELAKSYESTNDNNTAISNYQTALQLAKQQNNKSLVADLNTAIAALYNKLGRVADAENYYNNAIQESVQVSPVSNAVTQSRTADFYNSNQQYDKEIALRRSNIQILEEQKRNKTTVPSQLDVIEDDAELEEAVIVADTLALEPNRGFINDGNLLPEISTQKEQLKIGEAYTATNNFEAAIASFEASFKEASNNEDLATKKEAAKNLASLYKKQGNTSKALNYNNIYIATAEEYIANKEEEIAFNTRKAQELLNKQTRVLTLEKDRELTENKLALAQTEQELTTQINKRQRWIIYGLVALSLLLISLAYFMWRNNKQQRINNHLLALKSLRSQMNPHFIFNALNSVNSYIAMNDERAANKYLADFSKLMRSVLENSELDFIPLYKEIELLELYVKLEHERFKDKFDFEISIPDDLRHSDFKMPPMLLQPIIENAVWHGLRYKEEKGVLHIAMEKAKSGISVTIKDDGIGRKKSKELKTTHQKKRESKGLGNINNRINLLNELHDCDIKMEVTDAGTSPDVGTRVVVGIKN